VSAVKPGRRLREHPRRECAVDRDAVHPRPPRASRDGEFQEQPIVAAVRATDYERRRARGGAGAPNGVHDDGAGHRHHHHGEYGDNDR
jgi:hypothetical protein